MFSCSVFRVALLISYSLSFHRSFSSFSEKCVVFSLVCPGLDLENKAVFSIEGAPMGYGTIGAPSVGKYAVFAGVDRFSLLRGAGWLNRGWVVGFP